MGDHFDDFAMPASVCEGLHYTSHRPSDHYANYGKEGTGVTMKKDLIVAIDDVSVLELHLQPSRRRSSVVQDTKSTSSRFLRLIRSFGSGRSGSQFSETDLFRSEETLSEAALFGSGSEHELKP